MKINISFCAFLFIILVLSSCTKDHSESPVFNDSIAKIQTITEYFNGIKERVTIFTYDTSSRLAKVLYYESYNNLQYFDTVIYNGTAITITTYDNSRRLLEIENYTLNSDRLAILMTDTLGPQEKSLRHSTGTFLIQELESNIYGYDNFGYQNLLVSTNEYGGTHRYDMAYSAGNLISSIYQYMANDTVIQNGITTFNYFTDKLNTIGNLNHGISFLGKQNSNLLLSISDLEWSSADTVRTITNYRYEFDSKNRVSKQYITSQSGDSDDVTYLLFTYR